MSVLLNGVLTALGAFLMAAYFASKAMSAGKAGIVYVYSRSGRKEAHRVGSFGFAFWMWFYRITAAGLGICAIALAALLLVSSR